jgi:hypothetical protein
MAQLIIEFIATDRLLFVERLEESEEISIFGILPLIGGKL